MMNKIPGRVILAIVFFSLFLSCTAQITGTLKNDGQADLQVWTALEPRMTMLLSGFAAASGALAPGAPLLDASAISTSMAQAPGINSVQFKNVAPAAIEGPIKVANIAEFLASRRTGGFIRFIQNFPSGGRCIVSLNLSSGPEMLRLISTEITDYISALMAPLATGEKMTKAEYIVLVSSIYGKGIADEISQAKVQAYIDFPSPIKSVVGGTFSGRRAEFTVPLIDLLVLEKPLSYEVTW